jgi:hypothetical protein
MRESEMETDRVIVPVGWISAKELLPEHHQAVVFVVDSPEIPEIHRSIAGGFFSARISAFFDSCAMYEWRASHWMPAPHPPSETLKPSSEAVSHPKHDILGGMT